MKLNEFHDVEEIEMIGDQAKSMHKDHEMQMARADLYKSAKCAMALHDMLKHLPEDANLEGWVQAKITKAADYLSSVKSYLEYEKYSTGEITVTEAAGKCRCKASGKDKCPVHGDKKAVAEGQIDELVRINPIGGGKFKNQAERDWHAKQAKGIRKDFRSSMSSFPDDPIRRGADSANNPNPVWIRGVSKAKSYNNPITKAFARPGDDGKGVAEGVAGQQMSVDQLAQISDKALDDAYHYGRSSPGNTFGWQANLKSAEFAKRMIDSGVTDIEQISDAIHKGWNVTAKEFVRDPYQFDDTAKLEAAGKLEAKLAQRAKLMNINYAQLPEDEKEKDRVVARALLQAITGQLDELSRDTLKSYIPKRIEKSRGLARKDFKKAQRIIRKDIPRAMKNLKDPNYGKQGVGEDASAGASGSGSMATSMGGGNGFKNGGPGTIKRESSFKRSINAAHAGKNKK